MSNQKLIRNALVSIAIAATAASLLTASSALEVPNSSRTTPSGKLAVACGVPYDSLVFAELHNVFSKQAVALNRLGLGSTKADVCVEVANVAGLKADSKVDGIVYGNAAYHSRAVLAAATLYRTKTLGAVLDKKTLQDIGGAFELNENVLQGWTPGKVSPKMIQNEGVAFISENLALGGTSDIDATEFKDKLFANYVNNLNLSP